MTNEHDTSPTAVAVAEPGIDAGTASDDATVVEVTEIDVALTDTEPAPAEPQTGEDSNEETPHTDGGRPEEAPADEAPADEDVTGDEDEEELVAVNVGALTLVARTVHSLAQTLTANGDTLVSDPRALARFTSQFRHLLVSAQRSAPVLFRQLGVTFESLPDADDAPLTHGELVLIYAMFAEWCAWAFGVIQAAGEAGNLVTAAEAARATPATGQPGDGPGTVPTGPARVPQAAALNNGYL